MKTHFKKNGGFTLVELIVVIAILAILAAVAIPAYSGYIEKANRAGDEQLLADVNKAFASACLMNATDASQIAVAVWNMENMTVSSVNQKTDNPIVGSFAELFQTNGAQFKTMKALAFYEGKFIGGGETVYAVYNGKPVRVTAEDLALMQNSKYAEIGSEKLMNTVDDLTGWAEKTTLTQDAGKGYYTALARYYGIDISTVTSDAELISKVQFEVAQIVGEDNMAGVTANALVLYAAERSDKVTTNSVIGLLDGTSNFEGFEGDGDAFANAAAIYGLYMAYPGAGDDVDLTDPTAVLNAANNPEFKTWVAGEGKTQLDAYLATMNTIGTNAQDPDFAEDILENGFDAETNKELLNMMQGILGK